MNFNFVCRTCLSENDLTPIFKTMNNSIVTNSLLIATGVKIEINDVLPKNMCSKCVNTIKDINNFRNECLAAEQKLILSIKENEKQNVEIEKSFYLDEMIVCDNEIVTTSCEDDDNIKDGEVFLDSSENIEDYDEEDKEPLNCRSSSPTGQTAEQDVCHYSENEIVVKTADDTLEFLCDENLKHCNLIEPNANHRKKGREIVECDECNKKMLAASLRQHKRVRHAGIRPKCEHCGRKFGNKLRLTEHYRAKHGYEKLKCESCDFRSSSESAMKNHARRHSGEKPFVCEICGCKFHAAYLLSQHRQSHRTHNTVKCKVCSATFKANNTLHTHMRTCHSRDSYRCGICKKSFAALVYAKRHCKSVHGALATIDSVPKSIARKLDDCSNMEAVLFPRPAGETDVQ